MISSDRATNRSRPILRVRTGCLTCRSRKKKCGEERPVCRGCTRNHLTCTWPSLRNKTQRVQERDSADDSSPRSVERDSENDDQPQITITQPQSPAPAQYLSTLQPSQNEDLEMSGAFPLSNDISLDFPVVEDIPVQDSFAAEDLFQIPSDPFSGLMPRNPSLLPQLGNDSFELLSHYLSKTANSMGNGSTDANPFIVELVPLAFSSELILQLMLTQSAAHRAVMGPRTTRNVADSYYSKSLRLFRNTVNSFISGSSVDGLVLATGALVMCFTEVRSFLSSFRFALSYKSVDRQRRYPRCHFRPSKRRQLYISQSYEQTAFLRFKSSWRFPRRVLYVHSNIEYDFTRCSIQHTGTPHRRDRTASTCAREIKLYWAFVRLLADIVTLYSPSF